MDTQERRERECRFECATVTSFVTYYKNATNFVALANS